MGKHEETRKNREEIFLKRAKEVHGDLYDYSLVIGNFKNVDKHVEIICNTCDRHFIQSPYNHTNGSGCKPCAIYRTKRMTFEEFCNKSNSKYEEGHYTYFEYLYIDQSSETTVLCNKCDYTFNVNSYCHLIGKSPCPYCYGRANSEELFKHKANILFNNIYDYSLVKWVNSKEYIDIICKICDLTFSKRPNNHLQGEGCPACIQKINATKSTKLFSKFIEQAIEKHGEDRFIYDESTYVNGRTKMNIYCNNHNISFQQTPGQHLEVLGCNLCSKEMQNRNLVTYDEWTERVFKRHGHKYDYSKIDIQSFRLSSLLSIICKKHGEFEQYGFLHTKHGCPRCAFSNKSRIENEWLDYLGVDKNSRQVILPILGDIKLDGFDPATNTVYEFNGDFWHGNPLMYDQSKINTKNGFTFGELYSYMINRNRLIKSKGFNLIEIWESDWEKLKKTLPKEVIDTLNVPVDIYELENLTKSDFLYFTEKKKLSPEVIAGFYNTTVEELSKHVLEKFGLNLIKRVYHFVEEASEEELNNIVYVYMNSKNISETCEKLKLPPAFIRRVLKHKNIPYHRNNRKETKNV